MTSLSSARSTVLGMGTGGSDEPAKRAKSARTEFSAVGSKLCSAPQVSVEVLYQNVLWPNGASQLARGFRMVL